jgi:3-carboxy-cis,cis-muconate cycloisomerase
MSEPGGLFSGVFARGAAHGGADTSDRAWLQAMLDTEAALARALERAGLASAGAGAAVTAAARAGDFDPAELGRQAALTGNPVPALVRALTGRLGADAAAAGAVHHGATSQDVIDTAMMLLARAAADAIVASLADAATAAAGLAAAHAGTPMLGRTLLQQAVPVTFGLVAAGWMTGIDEATARLAAVRRERLAVQFGGAAGTLASLGQDGPRVAGLLAAELGLADPGLPWHTNRLRVVELAAALAGVCAATGKIARDVTLLAQTEVGELREGGNPGRGGSSAMPHKRNPVAAVAVLGCARQAPGLLATLAAAAEQEQQRAAGAWHAEWQPLAHLLELTASAAAWSAELLAGLEVDAAAMRANLAKAGGLPLAEHVTAVLAPALGRLPAHDLVADAAGRAAASGQPFRDVLLDLAEGVTAEQIDAALDPAGYLGATAILITRALAAHHAAATGPSTTPARLFTPCSFTQCLLTQGVAQVDDVVLGLLEQRAQGLGHVGQPQLAGLGDPVAVPLELLFLQVEVGLQRRLAVRAVRHRRDRHRGGAAEEVDLHGQRLGVLELLSQMGSELLGDGPVLGALDGRRVLHVLDDRLELRAEIGVEPLDELLLVHVPSLGSAGPACQLSGLPASRPPNPGRLSAPLDLPVEEEATCQTTMAQTAMAQTAMSQAGTGPNRACGFAARCSVTSTWTRRWPVPPSSPPRSRT